MRPCPMCGAVEDDEPETPEPFVFGPRCSVCRAPLSEDE